MVCEAKQEHLQFRISTVQPRLKGPSSELGLRCEIGKARGKSGGASDCDRKAPYVYMNLEGSQVNLVEWESLLMCPFS